MKNYDPNINEGIHTVMVTIQQWDYVGHVTYKIGGNCKGRSILLVEFNWNDPYESDCQLKYNENLGTYSAKLKNRRGNTLEIVEDVYALDDMVVKLEILDYVKESEENYCEIYL